MENNHEKQAVVLHSSCSCIEEEVIPESYPTWKAFFRIAGIGLAITLAEYGFLILLLVRHK